MAHAGSTQQISGATINPASVVPSTRRVDTTSPLQGGGPLSANLTLSILNNVASAGDANLTLAGTDSWRVVDMAPVAADRVLNLPAANSATWFLGAPCWIYKSTFGRKVTITPNGADTINGQATFVMYPQHAAVILTKIGTTAWAAVAVSTDGKVAVEGLYRNNLGAALAPTVNDDSSAGYTTGSLWMLAGGSRNIYMCVDASVGAADWRQLDGGSAGLANVAYVSKAGDDATAELDNEAKPYLTIAAAITAAAADIAGGAGPYTIQLGTGTWTENLTWAEQLSLRGLGNRVSIVSGTLTLTAGATAVANELNFSDVRITGDVALNFNAKTAGTSAVYCNACYFGDSFSMNKRSGGTDELRMDASTVVDRLTSTEVAAVRLFDSAIDDLRIAQSGGSERSTVVGCCGSILVLSGSAGTVSMTACQYRDGSLSIAVAALETSGCDFKGSSVTITAGTWIQNGCTFSNSGYLASAAPGTVDLTYWGGVVNVTAAATLTLPATARQGYFLTVKNGNSVASGNNVTIARNGNNIEGAAANYVIGPLSSVTLMGDGTNWWIIS